MAAVDASKCVQASSDEVRQKACGPCEDDGKTSDANLFCEICKVYLCFDCTKDHKAFKATKNHPIISTDLVPAQGSASSNAAFAILCSCNQKRAIEIYCEKHDQVICTICEAMNHKSCKTYQVNDKVTRDARNVLKELMDKANALTTEIRYCKHNGEAQRRKLDAMKEKC